MTRAQNCDNEKDLPMVEELLSTGKYCNFKVSNISAFNSPFMHRTIPVILQTISYTITQRS